VQLDDRLTLRPRKMPHPRWQRTERSGGQRMACLFIEFFAHSDEQSAPEYGYVLRGRMKMRRDSVIRRHLQAHREFSRLPGIPLDQRHLCACRQNRWRCSPAYSIGQRDDGFCGCGRWRLRGGLGGRNQQHWYDTKASHRFSFRSARQKPRGVMTV
jgi:hypothetical protein